MNVSADRDKLSHLSLKELQKQLNTSNQGLSQTQTRQRLSQDGYNQLPDTTVSPLMQFLSHFWGPIAWMIEAAVILSAPVRDWDCCFRSYRCCAGSSRYCLTYPGLGVIMEAIQESRRIFQRMNNYAIYRITETIRFVIHDPFHSGL